MIHTIGEFCSKQLKKYKFLKIRVHYYNKEKNNLIQTSSCREFRNKQATYYDAQRGKNQLTGVNTQLEASYFFEN